MKSLTWKADGIFHLCNPEYENATDENQYLERYDRDDGRCDAHGCVEVEISVAGTRNHGCTDGPADGWEEPSDDVGDAEFTAYFRSDGKTRTAHFVDADAFAQHMLGADHRIAFSDFCEQLSACALDSAPETD